jgi:5-methylcytosine-specific restriction endonuclease McrA
LGVPRKKRLSVFARDHYRCRYCGWDMTLHFPYPHLHILTVDHVVAKRDGGTDRFDNLVTCCRYCNDRKAHRPLHEFLKELYANGPAVRGPHERLLRWRSAQAELARASTHQVVPLV